MRHRQIGQKVLHIERVTLTPVRAKLDFESVTFHHLTLRALRVPFFAHTLA